VSLFTEGKISELELDRVLSSDATFREELKAEQMSPKVGRKKKRDDTRSSILASVATSYTRTQQEQTSLTASKKGLFPESDRDPITLDALPALSSGRLFRVHLGGGAGVDGTGDKRCSRHKAKEDQRSESKEGKHGRGSGCDSNSALATTAPSPRSKSSSRSSNSCNSNSSGGGGGRVVCYDVVSLIRYTLLKTHLREVSKVLNYI